ncbi:uncharacterized protein EV420DRAFT_1745596 [Desarmillaria tabescens]|uniref:F-box domain-containing protein n=1 Tax=Armillaria tabescens TaxID=1929756 RepID=A0AA39TQK5_ARMTA|nr:uncharacterized protein EV420DRAFT_1745596 [Desarmillaria tabescens]KAK0463063.1 hypothetical protein EV420DRAFT_1745596 [Desarmillaria tabescens]
MTLVFELVVRILSELWAAQYSIDDQVKTFLVCSLVSKQWSAAMKEVNSTHSFIPFSYNGGRLYSIKSLSSISHPMLCRTITFGINYVTVPALLLADKCTPSIEANRGVVSTLRKIFRGPNTPAHATHIYVDYVDDSQIHIPRFWVPPQITRLTIIYHYRRCGSRNFIEHNRFCSCRKPNTKPRVQHLTIMEAMPGIVKRLIDPIKKWRYLRSLTTDVEITVCPSISLNFIEEWDFPDQDIGLDFVNRCMFGERRNSGWSRWYYSPCSTKSTDHYIPMFEQVIPVGSVGYIDPLTRKFIILFNAIDPTSSVEPRIHEIASLLEGETTKLIVDPNYSPVLGWEYKRTLINTDALRAFMEQRSIYDILVGLGRSSATLYLTLGQAFARHLIGTHFDSWFRQHIQTILDVFREDHPYIRKGLDLVTTTVDSAQYAWLADLDVLLLKTHTQVYFRLNPLAANIHGSVWGEFLFPPRRNDFKFDSDSDASDWIIMDPWVHVSTKSHMYLASTVVMHNLKNCLESAAPREFRLLLSGTNW